MSNFYFTRCQTVDHAEMVIDDIFGLILDVILEFVPNIVWKLLFLLLGITTMAIGTTMLDESPQTGGGLILVGALLLIGSLVWLLRD